MPAGRGKAFQHGLGPAGAQPGEPAGRQQGCHDVGHPAPRPRGAVLASRHGPQRRARKTARQRGGRQRFWRRQPLRRELAGPRDEARAQGTQEAPLHILRRQGACTPAPRENPLPNGPRTQSGSPGARAWRASLKGPTRETVNIRGSVARNAEGLLVHSWQPEHGKLPRRARHGPVQDKGDSFLVFRDLLAYVKRPVKAPHLIHRLCPSQEPGGAP